MASLPGLKAKTPGIPGCRKLANARFASRNRPTWKQPSENAMARQKTGEDEEAGDGEETLHREVGAEDPEKSEPPGGTEVVGVDKNYG
jgi:hypothetical protein